jgi:hypothetical protein
MQSINLKIQNKFFFIGFGETLQNLYATFVTIRN